MTLYFQEKYIFRYCPAAGMALFSTDAYMNIGNMLIMSKVTVLKFCMSDKMAYANSVDLDQTAHELDGAM